MKNSRLAAVMVVILALGVCGLVHSQTFPAADGATSPTTAPAMPATAPAMSGTVTGKVLDKDGKPMANATVLWAELRDPNAPGGDGPGGLSAVGARGGRPARRPYARVQRGPGNKTDDNGMYTLTDVPAGNIHISASIGLPVPEWVGRGRSVPPGSTAVIRTGGANVVVKGDGPTQADDIRLTESVVTNNGGG